MDIGADLVAASDESKPFDLSTQSESLSELEEIGFADSKALEDEAVEMDPEEKQRRDLIKKQEQAVLLKKQELQLKVEQQKFQLLEAQRQLNEQIAKQKDMEKINAEDLKSHRQSLAQLAAKAKKRSAKMQMEQEQKFEEDMF